LARFVCSFSAVIVSGRSIFHWPPAVAEAPELPVPLELLPERPDELLPDVLERSAVELPAPELLLRLVLLLPAEFAPELELLPMPLVLPPLLEVLWRLPPVLLPAEFAPELLPRLAELLEAALLGSLDEELPERPLPEVELASLRGEDELLEPAPLLEPLPVLEPLPPAPVAPLEDSRTSETVTSGAPWLAGKVTIATPNPFCTPLLAEPPKPDDEELPLRPLELLRSAPVEPVPLDELLELRSVVDDAPMPLLLEELLRSALVPELVPAPVLEEPMPLELLRSVVLEEEVPLLLRSVVDEEEDEPMPPLVEDEPDRPPLEEPLLESERRLLLPRLPLLPLLPLLDEFTGQLESSAGFWTSPWMIWMFLN